MDQYIFDKVKDIKLLLLDVDGVLTDGRIIYDSNGSDTKLFSVYDGLGISLLRKAGIATILVTAKGSAAITPRAKDMQVAAVYENIVPKCSVLEEIEQTHKVTRSQMCFVGDDLVDISIMEKVGFPVAVFNAVPEVKQRAAYITLREGGHGAVREVCELILKANGMWQKTVSSFIA